MFVSLYLLQSVFGISIPGMLCPDGSCPKNLRCLKGETGTEPEPRCHVINVIGGYCNPSIYCGCGSDWECSDDKCIRSTKGTCSTGKDCPDGWDCVEVSTSGSVARPVVGDHVIGKCRKPVGIDEACGEDQYCLGSDLFCHYNDKRCHKRGYKSTPCNVDGSCYKGHCASKIQEHAHMDAYCQQFTDIDHCREHGTCQYEGGKCIGSDILQCHDCTYAPEQCCQAVAKTATLPTGRTCKFEDGFCLETNADFHGWCESYDKSTDNAVRTFSRWTASVVLPAFLLLP